MGGRRAISEAGAIWTLTYNLVLEVYKGASHPAQADTPVSDKIGRLGRTVYSGIFLLVEWMGACRFSTLLSEHTELRTNPASAYRSPNRKERQAALSEVTHLLGR